MHEVLVNRLGGLSLPWKSVVRLTDRPDMTLDTGIIPFSRLGVFYANLGSAEILFATRKSGPQNKW